MGYKLERLSQQIIRLEYIGDFTAEDAVSMLEETSKIGAELRPLGKKVKMYVNAVNAGHIALEARRMFTEHNKDPWAGKTAVVGVGRIHKVIARFMTVASGNDNIRFFDDEESALEWLENSD